MTLQPLRGAEQSTSVSGSKPSFSPLQETVFANQRSFVARELKSGTDYLVTVIAQYPNSVGEPVSAKARTSEFTERVGQRQQREGGREGGEKLR